MNPFPPFIKGFKVIPAIGVVAPTKIKTAKRQPQMGMAILPVVCNPEQRMRWDMVIPAALQPYPRREKHKNQLHGHCSTRYGVVSSVKY